MTPEELQREEGRICALLEAEPSPGGFVVAPVGRLDRAVEMPDGCQGLLSELLDENWLYRLTQVGLGPRINGFWSLALAFGRHGWANYEIRRMLCSPWSGNWYPEPSNPTAWPEGVRLAPQEEATALDWETDLIGVVVDGGPDCLVLCFDVFGNEWFRLMRIAKRMDRKPEGMARYMAETKNHQGSPLPVTTLQMPRHQTLQPYIFTPRQAGKGKHERCDPESRLFKKHWVVRLMRAPERKHPKKK